MVTCSPGKIGEWSKVCVSVSTGALMTVVDWFALALSPSEFWKLAVLLSKVPLPRGESTCNTTVRVPLAPGARSPTVQVTMVLELLSTPPLLAETKVAFEVGKV